MTVAIKKETFKFKCGNTVYDLIMIGKICRTCTDKVKCAERYIKANLNGSGRICPICNEKFSREHMTFKRFRVHLKKCKEKSI